MNETYISHSQPATAQDVWVMERLGKLRLGYFVEIGGYDGLHHSNTLALESYYGWKGLLVEANPRLYKLMQENRPRCFHDGRAVSCTSDSTARFSCADQWGGLDAFLPQAWKDEAQDRRTPHCWVTTVTLNALLSHHDCPKVIDYLSLDIEGAEICVLNEFFRFPKHRFRCMTIEYQQDAGTLMRLERLLEPHGYMLERVQAWDAFFYNKELR